VLGDNGGPARNTQDTQRGNVWNIYISLSFFLSFVLYAFQMYRTSLVSAAILCDGNTKKFVFSLQKDISQFLLLLEMMMMMMIIISSGNPEKRIGS
jgi:formate hydrogenlyase subunit 4